MTGYFYLANNNTWSYIQTGQTSMQLRSPSSLLLRKSC